MEGPQFVFLLLPCLAAVAVGWIARHWALAGAFLTGGLGCLFLVPIIGGDARFLTPLFTGAVVAGLSLIPLLLWKPDASVWSRMTLTIATAFAAHLIFLQFALAAR